MKVIRRKLYDAKADLTKMSFQDLIIWCCVANEVVLRKNIKKNLASVGFSVVEDDYLSVRSKSNTTKRQLLNALFTRGEDLNYCLVAHTDVCRDHVSFENRTMKLLPKPMVKTHNGRNILQDRDCKTQLGGDDRLGVAIALWIAFHTDHKFGMLLTTDEEIGLVSASQVNFPQLKDFKLLVQIDRGNHTNQIVNQIKDLKLCDDSIIAKLQEKLTTIGLPRTVVKGYGTDVYMIKKNGMCQNAINMTCGYHDSSYDSGLEYIDLQEAEEAKTCVISFLEDQTLVL